jgi:hypothetical protein
MTLAPVIEFRARELLDNGRSRQYVARSLGIALDAVDRIVRGDAVERTYKPAATTTRLCIATVIDGPKPQCDRRLCTETAEKNRLCHEHLIAEKRALRHDQAVERALQTPQSGGRRTDRTAQTAATAGLGPITPADLDALDQLLDQAHRVIREFGTALDVIRKKAGA